MAGRSARVLVGLRSGDGPLNNGQDTSEVTDCSERVRMPGHGTTDLKVGSMREELWVPSPEPAVGVSTPAGTCPGRLRRHCVIGSADPGQNPSDVRSGSYRVQGRGLSRDTPGHVISRQRR